MSPFTAFSSVGPLPHVGRGCFMPRDSVVAGLGPATGANADVHGGTVNGPWSPVGRLVATDTMGVGPAAGADGATDPRVVKRVYGDWWRAVPRRSPPWRWRPGG